MLPTMSQARFFCPVQLQEHSYIELPDSVAHHATRVLRLKPASPIVLFDGHGLEYPAVLDFQGKQAYAHVGAARRNDNELAGRITLVQGLAASDKMDWIIEKAVELGLTRVVPVRARRSVLQLNPERQAKRLAHWQAIVQSASEQCGRNCILQVETPCSLEQFLLTAPVGKLLFCDPQAPYHLRDAIHHEDHDIILLVGPEGGWSAEEQAAALKAGAVAVRFGRRVLRTETAGLALSAAISALQAWE